ncbi:LysM domain-containing receptor-like kinase 4family protein [Striga asiatica]|uniref:LysM domain-containing receptor-like kinase 4family protein n=1 Tax=Striga asiatica TaxID=4170 RepID=A0A5A7QTA9_STRAF|nr:LysM domain-containing receptor-like kinase 4family protein [Striga asiatica]
MKMPQKLNPNLPLWLLLLTIFRAVVKSQPGRACDALASYYIWEGTNLTFISSVLSTTINDILSYNPQLTNRDLINAGDRLVVPFSCGPVNQLLAHQFVYQVRPGNTYQRIAELMYSNLTTVEMLMRFNIYPPENIPADARLNVTVNCSCGDSHVSRAYGLFATYPLRPGESLSGIANKSGLSERLLQDYNPGVDFGGGTGLVFIPARGKSCG